ncbi:MAG: hypothetical protein IPP72_01610 [Chitinophagaceae bacterium]|nr:hypothetical protein [Chitinophagaceae bacterium]
MFHLLFWSTQVVEPDGLMLAQPGKSGFMQLANGYYVWRKQQTGNLTVLALIPVKWNYSVTNEYLRNTFTTGERLENNFSLSENENKNNVVSKEGAFLFSLQQKLTAGIDENNIIAAILRITAAVFILLFLQALATYFVQHSFYKGVLFLMFTVTILRLLSYLLPVPVNLRQYELFDPRIYAANTVFRSLGDLLINAVFFLWMVLFVRHYMQEKNIVIKVKKGIFKWGIMLLGIALLLAATFIIGTVIRSMVADSQISFDVINFFTLNIYSVVGFVVLGCLAIGFFLLSQIIVYLLQPLFPKSIMSLILVVTITGLAFLSFRISVPG